MRGGRAPRVARGGFTTLTLGNRHGQLSTAPVLAGRPAAHRRHRARRRGAGHRRGRPVQRQAAAQGQLHPAAARRRGRLAPTAAAPSGDVAPTGTPSIAGGARSGGPRLRRTLDLFYADTDFRAALRGMPREHRRAITPSSADCCGIPARSPPSAAPSRKVSDADADLVLAGALLHDIGKLDAYRWERRVRDRPSAASLLGHVTLGMLTLDRRVGDGARAAVHRPRAARCSTTSSRPTTAATSSARRCAPMTLEAGDPALRRQRQRQDRQHGRRAHRRGQLHRRALVSARRLWQLDRRRAIAGAATGE